MKYLFVLLCVIALVNPAYGQSASEYYEKALRAFQNMEVQESYIYTKNALQQDPDHLPSKLLMGRILLIDGFVPDAIEEFEEALQYGADKNLVLPYLARAYLLAGLYQKAFGLHEHKAINREVQLTLLLISSESLVRQGQNEKAIQLLKSNLRSFPTSTAINAALAAQYIAIGELENAQEALDRALAYDATTPEVLYTKGRLQEAKGLKKQALDTYKKVNQIAPDNPTFMRSLATILAEMENFEDARELVTKIEAQTPGDVQNKLLKARILALTNQQYEADRILQELSNQLSLLTEEQRNERIQLSLITGIVGYINNNYDLASTELSRYLSERKATVEILGMLADALLKLGYYKDAVKTLEKHQDVIVNNIDVATLTCELYIVINRSFKCESMLPKLEQHYPGHTNVTLVKTKLLMDRNKFEEAYSYLTSTPTDPNRLDVAKLKVALLANIGNFSQAFEQAGILLESQPDNIAYQVIYADLAIRLGDIDIASKYTQQALTTEPNNVPALVTRARIEFAMGNAIQALGSLDIVLNNDKRNVSALLLSAQIHAAEKQYEQAINQLLTAKDLSSNSIKPRQLLVNVYREQQDWEGALAEINQLLSMNRLSTDILIQKAQVLIELSREKEARSQLGAVFAQWGDKPDKLLSLSKLQVVAKDYEGAKLSLLKAIEQAPNVPSLRLEYIRLLTNTQQLDNAQAELTQFIQLFGHTPNTELLGGDLAIARKDSDKAFAHYLKASQMDKQFQQPIVKMYQLVKEGMPEAPFLTHISSLLSDNTKNHLARHLMADTLFANKKYDAALTQYEILLKVENLPRKAFIYNNLAIIFQNSDLQRATELSDLALKLMPDSAPILDTKGWLLTLNGNLQAGLALLREAYTLNSSEPSTHYHIAYNLSATGKYEEAYALLHTNNTLSKEFAELSKARSLFEELKAKF